MSHPDELIFLREQVRLLSDRVSLVEAFARQSERTRRETSHPKQIVPVCDLFSLET